MSAGSPFNRFALGGESVPTFAVIFDTSGRSPSAQVDPPNDLIAEFVNDEIILPVMQEELLARANGALAGRTSNFGSNVLNIDFELDGLVLEHNYLEGESSVKIGLRSFIDIVTAYVEAQGRTGTGRTDSDD